MDDYFDKIKERINKVTKILKKKGIQEELLNFDANENLDPKIINTELNLLKKSIECHTIDFFNKKYDNTI